MTSKVSVIVPIYNVEKYLSRCLDSLINQTLKEIEIICVNDGSTDNSLEILKEYHLKDSRIKIINKQNAGLSAARNSGLKIASGEYIGFVDSDDWVDLNFFEKLYNSAQKNNCDIAIASIIRINEHKRRKYFEIFSEKIATDIIDKIDLCDIPDYSYVWNKIYKSDMLKNKNLEFLEGHVYEDIIFSPQALNISNAIVSVPNTNYYYWKTPNSIVTQKKYEKDIIFAKEFMENYFQKLNIDINQYRTNIKRIKLFKNTILKIKTKKNLKDYYLFNIKIFTIQNNRLNIKIGKLKINLNTNFSKLNYKKENIKFENKTKTSLYPIVVNCQETLKILQNTNKSICRYGDGEFKIILGENISFQDFDPVLQQRLIEILKSSNQNILIGIPDIFDDLSKHNKKHQNYWRKFLVRNREKIYNFLDFNKTYYDSLLTRPYLEYITSINHKTYFKNIKSIWKDKDIIIIEGEYSRLGYNNDLFSNSKSIHRIICPQINAFQEYNNILEYCKSLPKNKLIILALGPTATVLSYDLCKLGYRALDIGHLDIEYEWFLARTKNKIPIKDKYVNEARHKNKISDISDKNYIDSIIKDFT